VTLTATVTGVANADPPGGPVTFTDGAGPLCTGVTLSAAGLATCSLSDLAAGSYYFTASYSGDANYTGQSASVTGYGVGLAPTSAVVSQSVPSPVVGEPLQVTATISAGTSTVTTGSVQWLVDGSADGSAVPVSQAGTATLGLSGLAAGSHTVTADYSDTANTFADSSQSDTVVVGQAATGTTASVTASALTATVTATPPGGGTPTGTVTFEVGGNQVGTAALSSGVATLAYASTGAETVSASYGGDADYQPSSASTATANPVITATVSSASTCT
jgi:hypothetical protein